MLGLGNSIASGSVIPEVDPNIADLGSTVLAWYQYKTGQTNLSGTDGNADNEMKWEDQSGGSRHATQRSDSDKPVFTDGGADFEDSSVSDHFEIQAGDGALDFGFDAGTPANGTCTIILAIKREDVSGNDRVLGSTGTEFFSFVSSTSIQTRATGTQSSNIFDAGTFPSATKFVLTYTKDGSGNQLIYKNDESVLTPDSQSGENPLVGTDLDITILGSMNTGNTASAFDGIIYEVVICDTVLSDSDRVSTVQNIMSRVGI
tara:strand:+ start:8112 stop:8891 length:780 start_codon:yes stop_codon:yes gene_type:complete